MLTEPIKQYLEQNHVSYSTIRHAACYTSPQTAQSAHISGKNLAKVTMVKLDGKLCMVSLPANKNLDLKQLQETAHAKSAELAREYEFSDHFPDCDVGAMPPFGDLYDLDVYVAESLTEQEWVAFNAGTHTDLVKMSTTDFLKLAHPKVLPNC